MKKALMVAGALACLVLLVAIVGVFLPKGHSVSRTMRISKPPEAVWAVITDYAAMPSWRTGLAKIERLPDRGGRPVWKETLDDLELPLEDTLVDPPRKLVRRIADPDLPFGGTWTYELAASPGGSTLTITEDGEIYNPLFRVVSRFTDPTGSIVVFLTALANKLGERPDDFVIQ